MPLEIEQMLREAHDRGDCRYGCPVCASIASATYRGYKISSQPRRDGSYVAKAIAPDKTEYEPFFAPTKEAAEELAKAKVRELTIRDLDEEPLTPEEEAQRAAGMYVPPVRPKRQGLSRFLKGEE